MTQKTNSIKNTKKEIPACPKSMRAQNLAEVLNSLSRDNSLRTEEELSAYFVERPYDPLHEMEFSLRTVEERIKVLFSGHRGCGKSTELNRLSLNLADEFFIVKFSVTENLNYADLNYIDILLVSILKLLEKAMAEKIKINEGILEHVFNWLHYDITEEKVIAPAEEMSLSSELNLFVVKMQAKLKHEAITRTILREKITPRLSELIDKINLTIPEIEEKSKKEVLIIIEDIDKVDIERAEHLFFKHGTFLLNINSKIIYTFPIALRYSCNFTHISKTFGSSYELPNIAIFDKQGNKNQKAWDILRDVILKRVEDNLLTEDAINSAIQLSGGLMIELITLIREASNKALVNKKEIIDTMDIVKSANKIRNDYSRMLKPEQYNMLKNINEDREKRRPPNENVIQMCLHNLSLLEYTNDDVWVDVHPIVKPLLT